MVLHAPPANTANSTVRTLCRAAASCVVVLVVIRLAGTLCDAHCWRKDSRFKVVVAALDKVVHTKVCDAKAVPLVLCKLSLVPQSFTQPGMVQLFARGGLCRTNIVPL